MHLEGREWSTELEEETEEEEEVPVQPSQGSPHGFLHTRTCCKAMHHIIQLHNDIGSDDVLDLDRALWRQQHWTAILRRAELHSLLSMKER